jgi:hypothetical protein
VVATNVNGSSTERFDLVVLAGQRSGPPPEGKLDSEA